MLELSCPLCEQIRVISETPGTGMFVAIGFVLRSPGYRKTEDKGLNSASERYPGSIEEGVAQAQSAD